MLATLSTTSNSLAAMIPPVTYSEFPDSAAAAIPCVPDTLQDVGLGEQFLEQLLVKTLQSRGEMIGRDLARAVKLKFSLIDRLLEDLKRAQTVQVKRSAGMGNVSGYFSLTENGRQLAKQYGEINQYVGPAPVPLAQYTDLVRRQRQAEGWLTPGALKGAYGGMVVSADVLSQIGPAVSSGTSFLIYGQPGNGKTYLAEALANLDDSCIYVPYALEYQGTVIQMYDSLFHNVVEDESRPHAISLEPSHDSRWFKCRRPFIVSGGELSIDMLDLAYNPVSKIYEAPLQLKANNGIYLIDDFGRQRATPAEVLNRWIVPMERRVDYLSLRSGGKITVPFETFLVFSTNLRPDQLGDEAFLRRIKYKMHLRNPNEGEFLGIFHQYCQSRGLCCAPSTIEEFLRRHYHSASRRMRRCHPRDIVSHALDVIRFEGLPMELTEGLLDRAVASCFVEVSNIEA